MTTILIIRALLFRPELWPLSFRIFQYTRHRSAFVRSSTRTHWAIWYFGALRWTGAWVCRTSGPHVARVVSLSQYFGPFVWITLSEERAQARRRETLYIGGFWTCGRRAHAARVRFGNTLSSVMMKNRYLVSENTLWWCRFTCRCNCSV
jgi:hypothetical protein